MIYFTENIKTESPLTYGELIETVKYKTDKSRTCEDICGDKTTMMKMVIKLAKEKYSDAYKNHLLMGFVSADEVALIRRRVAWNDLPVVLEIHNLNGPYYIRGIQGLADVPFDNDGVATVIVDLWYKAHPEDAEKRDRILNEVA